MKVLIAEDNADDRKILRVNFEHHGCAVLEAGDGNEALRIAKEQKPDLIISDALMPNMDGFQFLRMVKTDETLKDIPFIFYSAVYTGHREAELAISLGAEAFIIKPKEPNELWSEIKGLLEACGFKDEDRLTAHIIEEDAEFLREYSKVVAMRLEKKVKELEAAKKVIEAKEQEWQMTFDAIGDCVTIHDSNFNIVLTNKACEKLFGLSREEICSRKCFELFHGSDKPLEECPRVRAEESKIPSEEEFFEPVLNKWLSVSCFPLIDSNGEVSRVVHFARDITERKRSEEQLQVFRSLVDHSNDALFVIDPPTSRILDLNEQASKGLGFSRQELLEKRIVDIEAAIPTDEAWQAHVQELKQTGAMILEGTHVRKDKTTFSVEISVRYISLSETDYMVAVARDITERKQAEADQKKLEAQLLQAQKMEAVGQLTGGIAHDFNNILSAIVGYAGLLQMKLQEDDPLREDVDHILAASERAAALTQSLLTFSRKQIFNLLSIDLNELIARFQKFIARILREDIDFSVIMKPGALPVMADSSQLEQVLMNLAANARDSMPGGGRLTIETGTVRLDEEFVESHGYGKPGEFVCITISDTGTGMDEITKERIFEPFFTTKEQGKGTGLGLSMVYGIVKQHNGFIHVYSEPGRGTTFRIYLPMIETAAMGEEREEEEAVAVRGGTETVLIAEDNPAVRKLTTTVLRHYGYTVIEAVDGEDAVSKFMEHRDCIRLVILDGIMPKKNGREVYDEIKIMDPDVKVIFMSGYSEDVFSAKSMEEKRLKYILKPITPSELAKTVRSFLDEGKA